jgi:Flp pilus assembly protein TadD
MRNETWKSEIALWKDAVTKFPQNARAHCNLGAAYSFAGSCDDAIKELEIGLAAEPNNPKARSEIAYCYWKQGLPGIAAKEMLTAIQLDATNLSYYSNLALIYLEQGNSSDAISILKKAYRIDASNAQINALLGKAYCISGDFTNAIASFNKSLAYDHEDAYTYFDKGQCLLTYGNTDESRQNFIEALKKNPRLIDIYYYIGQSYEEEKDQEKAVYFYHQFLSRSSPDNPLNNDAIRKVPGSHISQ